MAGLRSSQSRLTGLVVAALVATTLPASPEAASAARWEPPVPDDVTPVDGVKAATWSTQPTWSAGASEVRGDSDVVWPEAGTETVAPGSPPGDSPVRVAQVDTGRAAAAPVGKVDVEVQGRAAAARRREVAVVHGDLARRRGADAV